MAGKFELKKARNGQFFFNLKASNGRVILTSERYKQRRSATSGIKSVQKSSQQDKRFDRRRARNGSPYFVLCAANGEVIGQSERYSSNAACENGIASVKKNAPDAPTIDLTA